MGLIWEIVKIAPKVKERTATGEDIREVFLEELNKEITQSLVPENNQIELDTLTTKAIITEKVDIDNGNIFDIETGETIKEL